MTVRRAMAVVQIGIVRVPVHQRRVAVPVGVRLAGRRAGSVGMLVVLVVAVAMLVLQRLMDMLVVVPLG